MPRTPLLIVLALFASANLQAQTPNQITLFDLNTQWRVHTGPDPAFASPTLDDSQWPIATPGRPIPDSANATDLWYRAHVTLPPNAHNYSLSFVADNLSDPGFMNHAGCPQFFVNGILVGQIRGYPQCFGTEADLLFYPIPDRLLQSPQLVVAIHILFRHPAASTGVDSLSPHSHLLLAPSRLLENQRDLFYFRDYSSNILRALLVCLVLIIVIAFALNLPEAPEYRILIVFLTMDLLSNLFTCASGMQTIQSYPLFYLVEAGSVLTGVFSLISFAEFVRLVLKLRRSPFLVAYYVLLAAYNVFEIVVAGNYSSSTATITLVQFGTYLLVLPITAMLPIPVLWAWRRRHNQDALLLSIPLLVRTVVSFDLFWMTLNATFFHRRSSLLPPVHYIGWTEVSDISFLVTLLLFVVVRTVRIVRARAALASEFQAAQTVQQLLLNRSSLPTPGFRIETVYLPAAEVGGDFFLISPASPSSPDQPGALIVLIGDVSGKGLTAAMRVAMILGVLRRETSRNPSEILSNLNEALITTGPEASQLGFTTACCLHIAPTGQYTLANAGHISPYLAGGLRHAAGGQSQELQAPPALPLGLAPGQTYETLTGTLLPTQTLVLMSDGIPEARNPRGVLYGFEALPALTQHPARQIAQTAQLFGQEDDITVLTLTLE